MRPAPYPHAARWAVLNGALSLLAVIGLLAGLLSLGGCVHPADSYVEADEATYKAVAPEFKVYVEADAKLSDAQKARRQRTLKAWRARLDEAKREDADDGE